MIAEEDRGAAALQCADDCIQSWFVNISQRLRALEPIGELIERRLLTNARREGVRDAEVLREIMQNTQRIEEPAVGIANTRRGYRRPHIGAVFPADALLDGVTIELACDLLPKLRAVRLNVLIISLVENRAAQQLLRRMSRERARLRIHAQEPPVGIHFADANVLIDPVLPGTGVNRRRKHSDKIRTHRKSRSGAGNLCDSADRSRGKVIDAHLALHPPRLARIPGKREDTNILCFCPQMAPSVAEYIRIAAGEKFQLDRATHGPFCDIADAFLQQCSRVSAALQTRF